jgi:amino acid transporter
MTTAESSPQASADLSLQQFGYQQEYKRGIRRFASFAVGFSFISITTGIFTTYGSILTSSGPFGIWTWPLVALGQLMVSLVFASLAARFPIAGYSYQWVSRLANPKIGWLVGWLAFTFLVVVTVSVDYALSQVVFPALFNYTYTPQNAWAVTAGIILVQALLIILSTKWSTRVNNTAVGTEVVGILGLTVLLLVVGAARGLLHPDHLFSLGAVSSKGYFDFSQLRATSPFQFAFILGAYTIVGFEAAANLSEETQNPDRVVPTAMWSAVALSGIVGFVFLIALNLASGNLTALASSSTPVADIVSQTLGSVVGDIFLVIVAFSIFACGLVIFITATRLTWAMARDGRFPAHTLLRRVNTATDSPVMVTAMLFVLIQVVLAIFAQQTNALVNLFGAATLLPCLIYLSTVVLYIATNRKLKKSTGFSLGRFEWLVVALAVVWLLFELSIFRDASFNLPWVYVGVMFGIGLLYFLWLLIARRNALSAPPTQDAVPVAAAQGMGSLGQDA